MDPIIFTFHNEYSNESGFTTPTSNMIYSSKVQRRKEQEKFYTKVACDLYQCAYNTVCKKSFNTEQKIKKHVKSHTFKKKIVCQFTGCQKRFSSVNNLKVTLDF